MSDIEQEVEEFLSKLPIGSTITTKKFKESLANLHGRSCGSYIPSDYCYNIINLDRESHDFKKGHPRLLEFIRRGLYKYLGPNYNYTGQITHKGIPVGEWENGRYIFYKHF